MEWIDNTVFAIKVFERPQMAQRCIDSIRSLWPAAYIVVADDSLNQLNLTGATHTIRLPHDVGCSAGRNAIIQATTHEYLVQVDDDYVFTPDANIPRMIELLQAHDELVMAGCKCRHIRGPGRAGWTKYFADVKLEGRKLTADKPSRWEMEPDGLKWARVDTISNFWVAKRRLFDHVLWDERLVIGGEHADFFQRVQACNGDEEMMRRIWQPCCDPSPLKVTVNPGRMQVAFIPSMWIDHIKKRPKVYQPFRARDRTYEQIYRKMWGISRVDRWRYRK